MVRVFLRTASFLYNSALLIGTSFILRATAVFLLTLPITVQSEVLGTQGSIYEIQEQDALKMIEQKLATMELSGEIGRQQEKLKEKALLSIEHPRSVTGLKPTEVERTFEKDLTITLTSDLRDDRGTLIHAAGTRINPLSKAFCPKKLLFFDGEDSKQLAFALEQYQASPHLIKLVLTNGPVLELMRTHAIRFYFDQMGQLVKYFNIQQVPALVSQQQDKLQIQEVKL